MSSDENSLPDGANVGQKRRPVGALQLGARKKPFVSLLANNGDLHLLF